MNDRLIQNSVVLMYRCTEAHAIPCTRYNNNVVDCLTPMLVNTLQLNSLAFLPQLIQYNNDVF